MLSSSVVTSGYKFLGDYTINAAFAQFSAIGTKTIIVMLFIEMVLIGPVGMVTRSLLNWLGWAECRTNSFSFLCVIVNACVG